MPGALSRFLFLGAFTQLVPSKNNILFARAGVSKGAGDRSTAHEELFSCFVCNWLVQ